MIRQHWTYQSIAAFALGISLAVATPLAKGAQSVIDRIKQSGQLVIAYRPGSMPFSYLGDDGQPIGYTIDICHKLADMLRKELKMKELRIEYLAVTPVTRITSIVEGKADLQCSSTTNNAERRRQVEFTVPHYMAGVRILANSGKDVRNIFDLRGSTVVTTKGSTADTMLAAANKEQLLNLNILYGKDHTESFGYFTTGKATAFIMDDVQLYSMRANSPKPQDYAVVGNLLSVEPLAIALSKEDPDFKRLIDKEMIRLINTQEVQKLYERWFRRPIPPKNVNLDLPMNYLLRDSFKFPTDKVGL